MIPGNFINRGHGSHLHHRCNESTNGGLSILCRFIIATKGLSKSHSYPRRYSVLDMPSLIIEERKGTTKHTLPALHTEVLLDAYREKSKGVNGERPQTTITKEQLIH